MNTIIINTLSAAVSEYSGFDFHAITPTHAGAATGLFALGGDKDLGLAITAEIRTATKLRSTTLKKAINTVFFSMRGAGAAELTVFGRNNQWSYAFPIRASGESRAVPGRGIRENYVGFGLKNLGGADFELDRIEALIDESKSRRV